MKEFISSLIIMSVLLSCRGVRTLPETYIPYPERVERSSVMAVFMDGTRDKPFKNEKKSQLNTNVRRLHLQASKEIKSLYIEGVGARGRYRHAIKAITTRERIMEAYRFIAENYKKGDSICLFGFSRGANQCRILSSFVYTIGIIDLKQISGESKKDELLDKLYRIYDTAKISQKKILMATYLNGLGFQHSKNYDTTGTTTIELMGLWDTVEAFVIDRKEDPTPVCTHLNQLYNVRKLFHAVSLDDNRAYTYTPILATHKNVKMNPNQDMNSIVEEVWFNGSHKDVGGGVNKNKKDELSGISLNWMLSKIKPYGIFRDTTFSANTFGEAHDMEKGFGKYTSPGDTLRGINKYWSAMNPNWNKHRIKVHKSVIDRLANGVVADFKTKNGRLDWYQWEPFSKCFTEEVIDCKTVWIFNKDCDCIEMVTD